MNESGLANLSECALLRLAGARIRRRDALGSLLKQIRARKGAETQEMELTKATAHLRIGLCSCGTNRTLRFTQFRSGGGLHRVRVRHLGLCSS